MFTLLLRIFLVVSVLVGLLAFPSPLVISLPHSFLPAFRDLSAPLGTDRLGRNIYSLYSWGILATVVLAVPARLFTILVSSFFSLLVFYAGKISGFVMQSVSSVFISIPSLLSALVIIQIFGSGFFILFLAILVSDWAVAYETIQNKVRDIESSGYVVSAVCFGAGKFRIFRKHVLPGIFPVVYLLFVTGIPSVIMTLSIFSFLGVDMGTDVFGPGLGEQISFSKDYSEKSLSSVVTPVVGILVLIYSFGNNFSNNLSSKRN